MEAKIWLFDPKLWDNLPLFLRSVSRQQCPTRGFKAKVEDLREDLKCVGKDLYVKGSLQIEVCPNYFERSAFFFNSFVAYLKEVLEDGGHVYLSVFTQPYLKVEENADVIAMYDELVDFCVKIGSGAISRLHYFHLSQYGHVRGDGRTLVWKIGEGRHQSQDEAIIREVSCYPGDFPSFGCGAYASFPGALFKVSKDEHGYYDYYSLFQQVKAEVERRGGAEYVMKDDHLLLDDIRFP